MQATVLIPTHDHGATLGRALGSALAQTVGDIEVFVVGDGVPEETRALLQDFLRRDRRVRFFDHPKGARHGETYRHAALAEARGRVVCYLSDDDLYLCDHVESMCAALGGADFANALPVRVAPDETFGIIAVDLALAADRALMLAGDNQVPLSCGAHTLAAYRALPHGWRTTPRGTPTDLYMWQQFLADPRCRAASRMRPTVLNFPAAARAGWTTAERCAELDRWLARTGDAARRASFHLEVIEHVARGYAEVVSHQRASNTARLRDAVSKTPIVGRAALTISRWLTGRPIC